MSATRGQHEARPANDFYETPEWCTRAVVRWLDEHMDWCPGFQRRLLDPGCGSGAITRELMHKWPFARIQAYDLVEHRGASLIANFMKADFLHDTITHPAGSFDLCVCNPPFSGPNREDYALDFIKRAMSMSRVGAFLVRLNWLAAAPTKRKKPRYEYLKANPPCVLILGKRPSFTGKGTDACEYCWLVFGMPEYAGCWELLSFGKEGT